MPHFPSVTLFDEERNLLWSAVHRGKTNARTLKRAQVLLKGAEGWTVAEVAEAFDVSATTVASVCRRFREGGVDAVLHDKRQERRRQALTGEQQAHLIAVACSPVPDGHDHWTLRLLASKAVELGFLRLPRRKAGGSDPLARTCFRLRDQRFTVRG